MLLGQRRTTIFIVVMLIGTLIPLIQMPESAGDLSDPNSLKKHSPIYIGGNSMFDSARGVVDGSGIESDPYIIANWSIDATGGDGIRIANTNKYFIIRNCHIYNGTNISTKIGISLYNTKNGIIEDNRLESNINGVGGVLSDNITIRNNSISDNKKISYTCAGIYFDESEDIEVYNNIIINNTYGIYFGVCYQGIEVYNNTICDNDNSGIYLQSTKRNRIYNNTMFNNTIGLNIVDSTQNIFYNNNIYDNSYNLKIIGNSFEQYNHSITSNNTVNGNSVYYWINQSNKIVPSNAGFVALLRCDNIIVKNSKIVNSYYGIFLYSTKNSSIINTKISNTKYGIYFYNSINISITNNRISNDTLGISMTTEGNNKNIIDNNVIYNNSENGIDLFFSNYNIISNNTISKNGNYGIISHATGNRFENNTISFCNQDGIYAGYGYNEVLYNKVFNNTRYGILSFAKGAKTYNNKVYNNSKHGIYVSGAKCKIYNNSIYNNSDQGINFAGNEQSIFNNRIYNNQYGIWGRWGSDGTIYNNYFSNTNNYYLDAINYIWNITCTLGRNIIGGPYIGGNYWSDYIGNDINGDGIGDSSLPYGPGDNLPLCIPNDLIKPKLKDLTAGSPTTGEKFNCKVNVLDIGLIENVHLEYRIDQKPYKNETMTRISGDISNGTYAYNITIPEFATKFKYNFSTNDKSNNWNSTIIKIMDIIDNDKPELVSDFSDSIAYTNESFNFSLFISDNIAPISAAAEFYFGSLGQNKYLTLNKDGNYFNGSIIIPNSLEKLNYRFLFNDSNPANLNISLIKQINVIDREKPKVILGSENILSTTGESFKLYALCIDNIDIALVKIYCTKSTIWHETEIIFVSNSNYSITNDDLSIDTSEDLSQWKYYFFVEDSSGNFIYYGTETTPFTITVRDNDKPIADAGQDKYGETGEKIILDASNSTDNIGISNYTWSFNINSKQIELYGKITSYSFELPGHYFIQLNVTDADGNWDTDILEIVIVSKFTGRIYLISPLDQALLPGPNVTLAWRTIDLSVSSLSFNVYFGASPNPPIYKTKINSTELEVILTEELMNYYWKVEVLIGDTPGPVSDIWSFQVAHALPKFGVEINSQKTDYIIEQGDSESIEISVRNTQTRDYDWIKIEIDRYDFPNEFGISQDKLYLAPAETQHIFLNFTVKGSTTVGKYLIEITASSLGALEYDLDVNDSIEIKLNILKSPLNDFDNDELPDLWEEKWFGDIKKYNGTDDPDSDGNNNLQEYLNDTDPTKPDTEEKPKPSKKDTKDNFIVIASAIAGGIITLILILLLFLFLKRKKKGMVKQESQPAAETEKDIQQQLIQQKPLPPQQPQNVYPPQYQPPSPPEG